MTSPARWQHIGAVFGEAVEIAPAERAAFLDQACGEDLEVFWRLLGMTPSPLFDTQIAAGLCGLRPAMGYSALVAELCELELPKEETNSNWLARPLSDDQLRYAQRALREGWTVRRTEREVRDWAASGAVEPAAQAGAEPAAGEDPNVAAAIRTLEEALGTAVRIKRQGRGKKQRGRMEIDFHSEEELHRVYEIVQRGARAGKRGRS